MGVHFACGALRLRGRLSLELISQRHDAPFDSIHLSLDLYRGPVALSIGLCECGFKVLYLQQKAGDLVRLLIVRVMRSEWPILTTRR